jgi:hypothetical protein
MCVVHYTLEQTSRFDGEFLSIAVLLFSESRGMIWFLCDTLSQKIQVQR